MPKVSGKPAKDPNKPKRPMSSFMRFVNEERANIKAANPDAGIGDIAKIAGEQWKECPQSRKDRYEAEYANEKVRYEQLMANYVPPPELKGKGKKAKKDPNAPKKPANAYFQWMTANRDRIKNSMPAGSSIGDISKQAGVEWKSVDASTKAKLEAKYQKSMEEYRQAMANYG